MKVCIILAFHYSHPNDIYFIEDKYRKHLPGILIDIYNVYKFVTNMKPDKIVIITDLINDINLHSVKESIIMSYVQSDIFEFMETLYNMKLIYNYINKYDTLQLIEKYITNSNKIFFYYTGHVHDGNILFPLYNERICYIYNRDDIFLPLEELRDLLLNKTMETTEIFVVLDCCNSNGLNLAYKLLNNGIYRLIPYNERIFAKQKIICISSTNRDETSLASKNGSLFSYYFFKYILAERSLEKLKIKINEECYKKYEQTMCINSTYPDIKMVWKWLISPGEEEIKINFFKNFIVIKNNE